MNTTNKQYSTQAIDPSVLDVLDISTDGKVVSAENWKTLWELVFKHINTLDAYCVTLEELRSEWSNSKALLDKQMLEFTSKYAALEQSFVHYGKEAPVNEHIKFWVQPTSNLKDKVLITFKELLATKDLLTNHINTLRDEMNIGFETLRTTLDNDYISHTDADNSFYTKSEIKSIVNNAVSTKADRNKIFDYITYVVDVNNEQVTITGCSKNIQGSYTIPEFIEDYPVTGIAENAFYGCVNLEAVTLPNSIQYIGEGAFQGCDNLGEVYFCGSEEQWESIDIGSSNDALELATNYYNQAYATLDDVAKAIANQVDNLFTYEIINSEYETNSYTKTVTITGTVEKCARYVIPSFIEGYPVTAIGASAFAEDDKDENGVILREVVIPDGVTSIDKEAFYGCLQLEVVILPDSIGYIGKDAFGSDSRGITVYYGGTEAQWSSIIIDGNNNNLISPKNIYYNQKPATVDYVNSKVVAEQTFDPQSENAQSGKAVAKALATKVDKLYIYEIVNGSVTITGAVKDCSKYVIPDTIEGYPVTTIGIGAFARKESLVTEVVIPDGVTRIEVGAFTECANLTTLTLPSSLTFIGEDAFGSSNFNNVYYGGSAEQWNAIEVGDKNDGLLNASNIYYNQHYTTKAYVEEAISSSASKKQDTLVSGTNIKTINGESILGLGDITIAGGSGSNVNNGNKVVVLDTKIRTYNTQGWKDQGAFGVTDYWGDVNNIDEINVGDIGILRGRNTDTGSDVLLINKITSLSKEDDAGNVINRVYTQVVACIQGGLKGDTGEPGPQGPARSVSYHKFRGVEVHFSLEKGHMYSFTVKDNGTTKVSIVDSAGNPVVGIANNTLSGMTNGMIICSDRCSITGLTGDLSITNLNAYISDRWDWRSTYYLVASDSTGVDIWDM